METVESTALEVVIEGKVLKSNLPVFCDQLKGVIKKLNRELIADEDFESANNDTKFLKSAEKSLKLAKEEALKQAEGIQRLFATIDDVSDECRNARLSLERKIKDAKEARKRDAIDSGLRDLELEGINFGRQRIEAAIKGKKAISSTNEAISVVVGDIKKEVNESRAVISRFCSKHGRSIAPDEKQLEQMKAAALQLELERRVERIEAETEKKRLEAQVAQERKAREEAEKKAREETKLEPAQAKQQEVTEKAVEPKATPQGITTGFDAEEEMDDFCGLVKSAFAPVKDARRGLKFPKNIDRAARFSGELSAAYIRLTGGGDE